MVDDHKLLREGLCSLLAKEPDIKIVGQAGDGREALSLVRELVPDVVVMDIAMRNLNGIEATRKIIRDVSGTRVLILSMHSDPRFIRSVLHAGASGYLLKDSAFTELVNAIRSVAKGGTYLSPSIAGPVVKEFVKDLSKRDDSVITGLTLREKEVLQLIAEDKSTKQIAGILKVSVKTVETHRQHLMEKLKVRNVAGLTKYAIREGLTSLEP